jgi:nucleotide-binding universal stress UspA family protein
LETSKIKRIPVALDDSKGSSKALDEAIYLARECQATLFGLCDTVIFN